MSDMGDMGVSIDDGLRLVTAFIEAPLGDQTQDAAMLAHVLGELLYLHQDDFDSLWTRATGLAAIRGPNQSVLAALSCWMCCRRRHHRAKLEKERSQDDTLVA